MRHHLLTTLPVLALVLAGCPKDEAPAPPAPIKGAESAAALASGAPATSASVAAVPIGAAPACKVVGQKVWTSGVNKLTGLTDVALPDGRVAVGLAVGLEPRVLVVGRNGEGSLMRVGMKPGTKLATPPKADEGVRFLLRVTPVKIEEKAAFAFADYRDEYKDKKRRRVACGPADSDDAWISFDDTSLLDRDPTPVGADRAALMKSKEEGGDEGYHELRDCRTFSDIKKNETWVVGSELRAIDKGGASGASADAGASDGGATDSTAWKASLVVDKGVKSHEIHLHENELKGAPPKIMNFEVPVSQRAADGTYVLAARHGGSLVVALLNGDKTMRTMRTYPGYPSLPDITEDGDSIVVATAMLQENKKYAMKALRLSTNHPELPKALVPIETDDDGLESESDPDFTRDSKGQRWMSYVDGERGNGHLEIVPVGEDFRATGKPFEITTEEERASEARLVALGDGVILVAYLREKADPKDKTIELVTEDLVCEVVKK